MSSNTNIDSTETKEEEQRTLQPIPIVITTSADEVPPEKDYPLMFSTRFWLAIISFFGFINLYALRINIAVAVVCMVNHTAVKLDTDAYDHSSGSNITASNDEQCVASGTVNSTTAAPALDGQFNWDKELQGIILGSFFYGYVWTQFPGGYVSGRFGGKRVMGYSMLVAALATLLTPLCSRVSPYLLIALRVLVGLCQGVVFPSMNNIWANWAPPLERSKLVGFTLAGAPMGNVLTFPISGLLCEYGFDGGWPSIFYILGIMGVLWFIAWMVMVSDDPCQHPRIKKEEMDYIKRSTGISTELLQKRKELGTPFRAIFTSIPVWSLIISHMCANWGLFTLLTTIPTYMKEVLKFDVTSNGALSALPYLAFWVCINVSGNVADLCRKRGIQTVIVRKVAMSIGTILPGAFLVGAGFVGCDTPYVAVALVTISIGLTGFQYSACFVNQLDIAPPFAGIIFGISNTAAAIPGFLGPYAVGKLTPHQSQEEWQVVFYITGVIYLVSALVYAVGTAGEIQLWVVPYLEVELGVSMEDEPAVPPEPQLDLTYDASRRKSRKRSSFVVVDLPKHTDILLNSGECRLSFAV